VRPANVCRLAEVRVERQVGVWVVLDGPAAGAPEFFLLRRTIMTEHARLLSELTGTGEIRADFSEVELSELQDITGGSSLVAGDDAPWCGTKPRPGPGPHFS
jgi:hypothetical protein